MSKPIQKTPPTTPNAFKVERALKRRAKNKERYWKYRNKYGPYKRCDSCGGRNYFCPSCNMYSQSCCIEWGVCMCS